MENCRMEWLQKNIGEDIQSVRFGKNTLKPIAVIIDNQQGKNNGIQELLKEKNFVVFSPRNLSKAAVENMGRWPQYSRDTYQASKLPSCLMIVDTIQEEKSQLLARTIIRFYNETAGNYNLLNIQNADGNMIPAFEGVGKLEDLLAKVGFIVQKSDDGNTITVSGDEFTLTVDGPSGEIAESVEETHKKSVGEGSLKKLYDMGKQRHKIS